MSEGDLWPEILADALEMAMARHGAEAAVHGARLRTFVDIQAAKRDLSFPPAGEDIGFGGFLDRYPETVAVRRRRGRDMLVAPANKPDLLFQVADERWTGIREDLFTAFTRVTTEKRPWYLRDQDEVIWIAAQVTEVPPGLVAIPPASFDLERDVRRSFASSLDDQLTRLRLTAVLDSDQPLRGFTAVVRSTNLQRSWHVYRTKELGSRITEWAEKEGLPWKESWISSDLDADTVAIVGDKPAGSDATEDPEPGDWRATFISMLERLDEADLKRINVPLDLLVKMESGRRRD